MFIDSGNVRVSRSENETPIYYISETIILTGLNMSVKES